MKSRNLFGLLIATAFGLNAQHVTATQENSLPKFTPLQAGAVAPDFEAVDENGKLVKLSDFKEKIVVLDIWATWCVPCNKAFPHLNALQSQAKNQNVVVLALCSDSTKRDFKSWQKVNKDKFSFTVLRDPNVIMESSSDPEIYVKNLVKEVPTWISRKLYPITSLPTTYIIQNGKVIAKPNGLEATAKVLEVLGVKLDVDSLKKTEPGSEGVPIKSTAGPR